MQISEDDIYSSIAACEKAMHIQDIAPKEHEILKDCTTHKPMIENSLRSWSVAEVDIKHSLEIMRTTA